MYLDSRNLLMSIRFEIDKTYSIQNPRYKSYRLTLPSEFFEKHSIKDNQKFDIELSMEDRFSVINYINKNTDNRISRKMTSSNHTIRIPSSIGDAMLLSCNNEIKWSSDIDGDEITFKAKTSYIPPKININTWDLLKKETLKSIKQSRKSNSGEIKEQEHFDIYLNSREAQKLDWTEDTRITMRIVSINNKLALKIQPISGEKSHGKRINTSGFKQNDARIYIPKSLVRSLNLADSSCDIYMKDSNIILKSS